MNNKTLTLGSLFSGSGGFELGGMLAGVQPVWNCEIEPFPIRVTTKRMPQVQHFGDISRLNGAELPPVDIITGGFPCQSVSVAGKREGVQHIRHGGEKTTRSGLFYEAVRIIKEMRKRPMEKNRDTSLLRTSWGCSPAGAAKTSKPCSKRSYASRSRTRPRCLCLKKAGGPTPICIWETDGALLTELCRLNIGECPNEENASTLSQILEAEVPERYYLSPKACQGILRRASVRGKELPPVLKAALERQALC